MKTEYGLQFILLDKSKINEFTGKFADYDRFVAECQIANCGKIIIDAKYGNPIDNEYDLEEIYEMIKNED